MRLAIALLVFAAQPLGAQTRDAPARPWPVTISHYAKWPALVSAGALLAGAALDRRSADSFRDRVDALCGSLSGGCALWAGGRYSPDEAEALAAEARSREARAHRLIIAGELTLIAAGAMWVVDLVNRADDGPDNIPYTPFRVFSAGSKLGVELPWPAH